MTRPSALCGLAVSVALLLSVLQPLPVLAGQGTPSWFAGPGLFRLVVFGSLVGLTMALLGLLAIWWLEWRDGQVW